MTTKVICEYIWLGGNDELRSKIRVVNMDSTFISKHPISKYITNIPSWNYDGSSTSQASGSDSEVTLIPCAVFESPFNENKYKYNILVLCDTYTPDNIPLKNNHRPWAKYIFDQNKDAEPWYGIEQEYFIMNPTTGKPLGFPENGFPSPQGQYYCSVGATNTFGREIAEEHLIACLKAGITISGINAEVAAGQWEYQIGPCTGIDSGDQLWVSRYILERIAEKYGLSICWHPKPITGDWNGSGCHTNYSTKNMREGTCFSNDDDDDDDIITGMDYIITAIKKLEANHMEHMKVYGSGNELRMTGKHETASFDKFTYGVADRGASVRIGNDTIKNHKGYFEDRRPSSNMNPYLVTSKIFETTVLS